MPRRLAVVFAAWLALATSSSGFSQDPAASDAERRLRDVTALIDTGRAADARSELEHLAADAHAAGDRAIEGGALGQLARALRMLGDEAAADARFAQAEAILTEVGNPGSLGLLQYARGQFEYARRDVRAADVCWARALEQFERAGAVRDQARALYSLTFVRRQDEGEVTALLDRALGLARRADARDLEGQVLQRWGDEHVLRGEYGAALGKIQSAVTALQGAGRPSQVARALISLGRVFRLHGSYDRALGAFERALAIHRTTDDVAGTGQSMNAVAVALRVLGRTADAIAAGREATTFLEQRRDRSGTLALAYHTLATALEDEGRFGESLAAVDRSLGANPDASDRSMLLATRAGLLAAMGRIADASEALAAAELLAPDRHDGRAVLLGTRADVAGRAGRLAEALDASASLLALYERERASAAPVDGLKAGFDNVRQWAWAQRVRLLADAGRHDEALEATEGARARAFVDLLAARRLDSFARSAVATRADGGSHAGPGADLLPLLPMRGDRTSQLPSPSTVAPPRAPDIARHAARLGSTVLSYWVEREAVRIWAVSAEGRLRYAVVRADAQHLARLVDESWAHGDAKARAAGVRGRAGPGSGSAMRALRDLHDLLIRPIAHALPAGRHARLTIVPHGPLFRLSFAALRAPSGRYLIEDFEIHYTPSAGVLGATEAMRASAATSGALVVAGPSIGPALAAESLGALPGAAAEGRAVAGLTGARASGGTLVTGGGATEEVVRRLSGGRRVLHFATHAIVSDDHPLDSFLALAGDSPRAEADGRLTAEEVYGLRLDADLVVLSACRTARGRITGDGLSGLARAFVYAGTPSLIATLSELPDVAGAFALPRFYRARSHGGDKAAALRSAQLALLRALRAGRIEVESPAGRFVLPEHPSLWAAMVLIGEP
jgi:CHAT domain-containing protein/tetratricopeptide (TPR) repeat protein